MPTIFFIDIANSSKIRLKSVFFITLKVLAILILSSCQPTEPVLRVGANNWVGYAPLFLAQEIDEYKNTSIKILELPSSSEVIHALKSGNLEVAALTLDEVLTVIEEGLELEVILVLDISNGADALLAKPEFHGIKSLKGKKIAVENTAVGGLLLDQALGSEGVLSSEIEIIGCTFNNHQECYKNADAVVTFEPAKSQIIKEGATSLFDSSQMNIKIMDVLAIPKEISNSHPKSLAKLINGYFTARKFMRTNQKGAYRLIATQNGLSPSELALAYEGVLLPDIQEINRILSGSPSPLSVTAYELAALMVNQRLLNSKVNVDNLSNSSFIKLNDE